MTTRRSSFETNDPPIQVYWRKDIEARSIEVWGSPEAVALEKEKRARQAEQVGFFFVHITSDLVPLHGMFEPYL